MARLSKDIEQCLAKNGLQAWENTVADAEGLGPTAQREIKRSQKLVAEAKELSFKALGRKRTYERATEN